MKKFYTKLIIVLGLTLFYQLAYSQPGNGTGKHSVDVMVKYFNNDQLDSASILSDSIVEDPSLADNSEYWFYRGLIFKEMFKKHERLNPKSNYRAKSELALVKALDIEKDNDIISDIKKNMNYVASTYYNDAVRLLQNQKPDVSLSIYTFDRYVALAERLSKRSNEYEYKFLNALGSYYANLFNDEKDITADAYYTLAKKCFERILATDSNQTLAKYNLVVLETNYKTKTERLLKEESAKKDQVILNLNAVKNLADEKLIESQMIKINQAEELKVLRGDQKNKELQIKADSAIAERKDVLAQRAKQKQDVILWSMTIGLLTILAFSFLVYKNSREKEKLNKELEKLTFAVSKSNNTVLVFNANLELEWVNKNFSEVFGMPLEEYKRENGKTLSEMSTYPDIENLVQESIRKKTGMSYESVTETKNMGRRWFQSMLSPIFDESGKLLNMMIIDSDITQLKAIEQEIRQKNKDITDSIHYAKRIQESILPAQKKIEGLIKESFILYNPKDILSGDLYWFGSNDNTSKVVIAAVDCTGHGVPGALLTIMANDLLNTIVLQRGHTNPKDILNDMNVEIINLLAMENEEYTRDGMDMAIIELEQNNDEIVLRYTGAHNPLYYIRDNQLNELAPVKFNIGSMPVEQMNSVTCHTLEIKKNDMVYMFSDGYADQLSGITGKKFMKGKFKQLLLDVHKKPLHEQKTILEETTKTWRGDTFQTDDMLVMGFRF